MLSGRRALDKEEGGRRRGTWAGAAGRRRGWGQGWGWRRRRRRDGSIGRRGGLLGASVGRGEAGGRDRRPAPRARTEVEAAQGRGRRGEAVGDGEVAEASTMAELQWHGGAGAAAHVGAAASWVRPVCARVDWRGRGRN